MPGSTQSPLHASIDDRIVYLVRDDFGQDGRAFREADYDRSDFESGLTDLRVGQFENPVTIIAFHFGEQWARDVWEEVARELHRRASMVGNLPVWLAEFVERHSNDES